MGMGQVAGEIPLGFAQGRVIPLHQAGEVIDGEQSLADGVGQGIQPEIRVDAVLPHREGDVHLTLAHLGQAVLCPLLVTQPDPRCLAFELAQVERREQGEGAVHAGDDELPLCAGGIEGGGLDQVVQGEQYGLQLQLQIEGARGGIQPVGGADEQGIVEGLPQATQGLADGGLAQMQAAGGPAAIALFQQDLQDNQQIKIYAPELFQQHDMNPLQFLDEFIPFVFISWRPYARTVSRLHGGWYRM